jgi:hypothetical protein
MRCQRCLKPLKKGYYVNGIPYDPECVQKVVGRLHKLKKPVQITRAEDKNELQQELDL